MTTASSDPNRDGPYCFDLAVHKIIAWITIVLFAGFGIAAFNFHQYGYIWIAAGLVIVGIVILMTAGSFEISTDRIIHRCTFGTFKMSWGDVRQMEQGPGVLVLLSDQGRLVVPIGGWSGPERFDAWHVLTRCVKATNIAPFPSNTASYKWHSNVRLRS